MADSKISALTDGAPAVATDVIPISRTTDVATRRLALSDVRTLFATTFALISHTHSEAEVTGLVADLLALSTAINSHKTRHQDGGADEIDVTGLSGLLADAQVPLTENTQDIVGAMLTDSATIDFTYNDGVGTETADIKAASVTEAMQVLADNVTNDVSIAKHGYAPKAPNDATKYLDGTGAYTVPVGSGGYTDEQAQDAIGAMIADTATIDLTYTDGTPELKADVKAASITEAMQVLADNTTNDASTSKHGFLKKLSNVATEFMNGVGAWAVPASSGGAYATAQVSFNTDSAEHNILSFTVTGGDLSTNKKLFFFISGSMLMNSGGGTYTWRLKYGATTLFGDASAAVTNNAAARPFTLWGVLFNNGATNVQVGSLHFSWSATTSGSVAGIGDTATPATSIPFASLGGGTAAEDSTANKTFTVSIQFSVSNAAVEIKSAGVAYLS